MTLEEKLVAAVTPIVADCQPNFYKKDLCKAVPTEYCSYSFYSTPVLHADSKPSALKKNFNLHYTCPMFENPEPRKMQLCKAIAAAGFTFPSIINVTDSNDTVQCFAFEFEGVEYGTV